MYTYDILNVIPGDYSDLTTHADVEYIFECLNDGTYPIELSLADNDISRLARMARLVQDVKPLPKFREMLKVIDEAYIFRRTIISHRSAY
jgi:hypothetical protein